MISCRCAISPLISSIRAFIKVAGRTIENIYDYTYSLDELEVGVPVQVRVRRGDEELDLTLTPASRD